MARKQRFPNISAEDAHAALRWLAATGKVTAAQITGALKKREALVAEIKERLEQLGGEGLRFLRVPQGLNRRRPGPKAQNHVSAAARAAWRAQGRYLAAVKPLRKADRLKVKAIRQKNGVRAAIAAARRIAR